MSEPRIWTKLLTYDGLGVALSPIHIVLLLLLGHGLLLDMTHGSDHRTGLDLIGGGALIALGGRELSEGCWMKEQRPLGAAPWIVSPQCRFPCCC